MNYIKYKTLFESNPDYTIFLDSDAKIIDANIVALKYLGYNLEDIKGLLLSELGIFPDEDIKIHKERIQQLLKGKNVEPFLARLIDKEGKIHWCQNYLIPIRKEGNLIGLQAVSHDVTGKRVAENVLKESEKSLFDIIDFLPDATFAINSHGKVMAWNRAMEDITGFKANAMMGKGNYEYSLPVYGIRRPILIDLVIHPDENFEKHYDFIEKHGDGILVETEAPLKGINRNLWGKAVPLYDNKGHINGAIEVIRDITEQKKAGNKIIESLREKEVLLQEVHHRVKNNMQIISSLLNLQINYVDDEEVVDVLKESQNRVKSMAIIHEKLYMSDDLAHINFDDYIQNLVKNLFYSYKIEDTRIKPILKIENVNLNIETGVPCGLIISELVSNSLKYAFPYDMNGEIHVSLKSVADKYELIIGDTGIGLPEDLDFNNLESLGLLLVTNLIEQIDGELTISRSPGTEFIITFKELEYKERL